MPILVLPVLIVMALVATALGWWMLHFVWKGDLQSREHPLVVISAEAPALTPDEIENLVVAPIEMFVQGVPEVRRVCSTSRTGAAAVWVEFAAETDVFRARQLVVERLELVREGLPEGVHPRLAPNSSSEQGVLLVGLRSEARSAMELRELAEVIVRRRLLTVPGVADVSVRGGVRKQCEVVVSPERLAAFNVTLQQVVEAVGKVDLDVARGRVASSNAEVPIRRLGRGPMLEDLAATPVVFRDSQTVFLRDLAEVRWGGPDQTDEAAFWIKGASAAAARSNIILAVLERPNARAAEVEEAIDQLRSALPPDVSIEQRTFVPDDLMIAARLPNNIDPKEASRLALELEATLIPSPEVRSVWRRGAWGRLNLGDEDPSLLVEIRTNEGRTREQVLAEIRGRIAALPSVEATLRSLRSRRLGCPGAQAPIAVKVWGPDFQVLRAEADNVYARLRKVPGVVDLQIEPARDEGPELTLTIKREEAARHGVNVADLTQALETALGGHVVGQIVEGERHYDLVVRFGEEIQRNPAEIAKLLLATPSNGRVALRELAEFRESTGPATIYHENGQRCLVVSGNLAGRERTAVQADIEKTLAPLAEALHKRQDAYRLEW